VSGGGAAVVAVYQINTGLPIYIIGTGWGAGGPGASSSNSGTQGIVALKYPDSFALAQATTGSPTVTTTGGYRIYRWTTSGSITF
jgi:hypothetical protein